MPAQLLMQRALYKLHNHQIKRSVIQSTAFQCKRSTQNTNTNWNGGTIFSYTKLSDQLID